jgi:hypothetical protein
MSAEFQNKAFGRFTVNVNPFGEVIIRPTDPADGDISDDYGITFYTSLKPHGLVIDTALTLEREQDQIDCMEAIKYATEKWLEWLKK